MAQLSWTYADNSGFHYNIGLYHGSNSGHVIVHCNENIVIIDFSILETKQYSFYVGQEFFELDLTKKPKNTFSYQLRINQKINSPLNILRRKYEKRYNLYSFLLGLIFFGTVALTSLLLMY